MSNQQKLFGEDQDFSSLVKKARRKSLVRNTFISIVVCIVLLFSLYILGSFVMQKKIEKDGWIDGAWQHIEGANVESGGTLYHYAPLSAVGTTHFTKRVAGVPVPWGSKEKVFTFLGTSKWGVTEMASGAGNIDDKRIPFYFQGERLIEFFHPGISYEHLFDERPLLDEIDDTKVVEFAFSFDEPYTVQEIQDVFSDHIAWYWVDTFSPDELDTGAADSMAMTVTGDNAIGFQHSDFPDADMPSIFMTQLEWLMENGGRHRASAKKMYGNITGDDPADFSLDDLKIIGVVVTGSPDELKEYDDVPFIRTAILGATVDKY